MAGFRRVRRIRTSKSPCPPRRVYPGFTACTPLLHLAWTPCAFLATFRLHPHQRLLYRPVYSHGPAGRASWRARGVSYRERDSNPRRHYLAGLPGPDQRSAWLWHVTINTISDPDRSRVGRSRFLRRPEPDKACSGRLLRAGTWTCLPEPLHIVPRGGSRVRTDGLWIMSPACYQLHHPAKAIDPTPTGCQRLLCHRCDGSPRASGWKVCERLPWHGSGLAQRSTRHALLVPLPLQRILTIPNGGASHLEDKQCTGSTRSFVFAADVTQPR